MKNKMKYVIVRTCDNCIYAGYLKKKKYNEVVLMKCRQIKTFDYYMYGYIVLSQLAMEGAINIKHPQFSIETDNHTILNVGEIIPTTEKAKKSIQNFPKWRSENK